MRLVVAVSLLGGLVLTGCRSPEHYREKADKVADKIITEKQQEAVGKTEPLQIERPSDILRRRLIASQNLPVSSAASLGTDALKPIPHWPDKSYPPETHSVDANIPIEPNKPLKISLVDALQIAAHNSPDYQTRKEQVFSTALSLDLARNAFRTIFTAGVNAGITTDTTRSDTVTTATGSGSVGVSRRLMNGATLGADLVLSLTNMLTQGGLSKLGLTADPSISMELLRGAGRHIVTEPLTQAERDMVYAIWVFERYKRTFAVDVATTYFSVLQQLDSVRNEENNYRAAIQSARFSRRLGDAGRLTQIQVDQAAQSELRARTRWISARQTLQTTLDTFKTQLGLPVDALIEADSNDLTPLRERGNKYVEAMKAAYKAGAAETAVAADAAVELVPPSKEGAGPYEIDEEVAIRLALENRLDLREANGRVYDAQRKVVVAADNLRVRLTLTGGATFSDDDDDGSLRFRGGTYSARVASVDLPIDERSRTSQRNDYRNSLITLEQRTRSVQSIEDQIKAVIRRELRTLLETRENLKISAQQVVIAENSVNNATLLLEAGRVQIRDLLEAQNAFVDAKNALTGAIIGYRRAELQLQRDLDLLTITKEGLLREFSPGEIKHDS